MLVLLALPLTIEEDATAERRKNRIHITITSLYVSRFYWSYLTFSLKTKSKLQLDLFVICKKHFKNQINAKISKGMGKMALKRCAKHNLQL